LLEPKILRQKIEVALAEKNVWLERVYGVPPLDLEETAAQLESFAQRIRPYVSDTSLLVDRALREGREVLLEGAQGTLLDLDHGHVSVRDVFEHGRRKRRDGGSGSGLTGSTG